MSTPAAPSISAIVPLYGTFDSRRAEVTLESLSRQQGIDLQIVIAESGHSPRLQSIAASIDATYSFRRIDSATEMFSPGKIRNDALLSSDRHFIYATDADIVIQNDHYLLELIALLRSRQSLALRWPPMRRLPIHCFEQFCDMSVNEGLGRALSRLHRPNEYVALTNDTAYDLKIRKRPGSLNDYDDGLIFTSTVEDYERYMADPSLRGLEPLIFHQVRHIGGLVARRTQLLAVGGYCEQFLAWGNEDTDLQWKLAQACRLEFIPDEDRFEVLHLDHAKGHFCPSQWQRNKALKLTREARPLDEIVAADRRLLDARQST